MHSLLCGFWTARPSAVLVATLFVTGTSASVARAQGSWSVVRLHPEGAAESRAHAVHGNQQVGFARFPGGDHAALWTGNAASWVDLNPEGASESRANGVCNGQQVGWVRTDTQRASLWFGTASSWTDLHPPAMPPNLGWSEGWATDGATQVGLSTSYAAMWAGTNISAALFLVPQNTRAYGVHGGQQVGVSNDNRGDRGILWNGPGNPWEDLTPPGALASAAYAVDSEQQIGWVRFATYEHAAVWQGTAQSWTDLNPGWAIASQAWAVSRGIQAGAACVPGTCRAGIWHGSATSWTDLADFLPPEFTESYARGIWQTESATTVVGYGYNSATGRYEALLWRNCRADSDGDGEVLVPDIFAFLSAWFAGDLELANFNGDGFLNVADIFAFLSAWFAGCP